MSRILALVGCDATHRSVRDTQLKLNQLRYNVSVADAQMAKSSVSHVPSS